MTEHLSKQTALGVLERGDLEVTGRLVQASNGTFYARAALGDAVVTCVYKPIRGERPLWDFTDGTLADREVAAYLISEAADWAVVPPTVMRDGPFGPGMAQLWVDVTDEDPVDIVADGEVPDGWLHVLDAYDAHDRPVSLIHEDTARLRRMAIFDVVVNNADRKGGHVLPDAEGGLYGCDHGVSLHAEYKLRTVLWGWAGEPLTAEERKALETLRLKVGEAALRDRLLTHLTQTEYDALLSRIDDLVTRATLPYPARRGPSIPWPAF
ncbi:MAG: SCO1664 family protein [Nocardioidaceae bacterium]